MDTKTHFCNLIEIKLDIGTYDMHEGLVTTLVDGYLSI